LPIRDFISLSFPLVAVSLLFFGARAVKKQIPEKCGAAVANKKLSDSPAVFPRDANDDRKDDHHHGNDDDRQIRHRACLGRLRVEDFYNVRNQQPSAPQLHVHRLLPKPAPRERQRSSQDSIVPSTSQEWKNFRSTVELALHTGSIAPEISRYSRARE
jgi:hypothetical protein